MGASLSNSSSIVPINPHHVRQWDRQQISSKCRRMITESDVAKVHPRYLECPYHPINQRFSDEGGPWSCEHEDNAFFHAQRLTMVVLDQCMHHGHTEFACVSHLSAIMKRVHRDLYEVLPASVYFRHQQQEKEYGRSKYRIL